MAETLLVKLLVRFFALLPFPALYGLSSLLHHLLAHLFRYRRKVILENLRKAFPDKGGAWVQSTAGQFYAFFSDLLLESLKGPSLSRDELLSRFCYRNPEIFDPLFQQGRSAILLGSHAGNWEWGVLSFPLVVRQQVIGIYKPLSNKRLNRLLCQLRSRWGLILFSMRTAGRAMAQFRDKPCIYVLIADQTPSDLGHAHWLDFLHQDTPFLHGADKLARQSNYPVFFFQINQLKRGHYEVIFRELCANPAEAPEGEITRLFAAALEAAIADRPQHWLWSHRRWKRKRQTEAAG
jgi:KDO2-lipid IV(A) lauroyltransferase